MSNSVVSQNIENLYEGIFFSIKDGVDKLLPYDEDTCNPENPFVDIEAIAINIGIKEIRYVSPDSSPDFNENQHAVLKEIDGEYIILVNNRKTMEEQRFSIAHEIEHFISMQVNKRVLLWNDYFPSFSIAQEIAHLFTYRTKKRSAPKSDYLPKKAVIAARSDYLTKLKTLEKQQYGSTIPKKIAKDISKLIANFVSSTVLIKPMSEKKIYVIFQKHAKTYDEKTGLKKVLYEAIVETIKEEIADYFAANLLVPTELFILWEDKSDNKIARAFGVPKKCISKRRNFEIKYELEFLAPKNFSSGVKIEKTAPLTHDKLNHILGGSDINAKERD